MASIYCYVDEYGDIGTSHKSSPVFALSGVLVAEEDVFATRELMTNLRADLAQGAKSLHWVKNARSWDRRQHIVDNISKLPVKLIFTIAVKRDLRAPAPLSIQDRAAITPGVLSGNLDVSHFAKLYPLIRRSGAGEILNYGIKETSPFVTTLPWWGTLG